MRCSPARDGPASPAKVAPWCAPACRRGLSFLSDRPARERRDRPGPEIDCSCWPAWRSKPPFRTRFSIDTDFPEWRCLDGEQTTMLCATNPAHDLLFGLLALQNGLIEQGQLVAAFQAWTR